MSGTESPRTVPALVRSARRISPSTHMTRDMKLPYIDCMHLFINGDEKTFDGPLSLAELIAQLGMKGDRVAVELNREIVARAQWAETRLNDGDRLEIVHFVGGG